MTLLPPTPAQIARARAVIANPAQHADRPLVFRIAWSVLRRRAEIAPPPATPADRVRA